MSHTDRFTNIYLFKAENTSKSFNNQLSLNKSVCTKQKSNAHYVTIHLHLSYLTRENFPKYYWKKKTKHSKRNKLKKHMSKGSKPTSRKSYFSPRSRGLGAFQEFRGQRTGIETVDTWKQVPRGIRFKFKNGKIKKTKDTYVQR